MTEELRRGSTILSAAAFASGGRLARVVQLSSETAAQDG
jgi:hypothetical protein